MSFEEHAMTEEQVLLHEKQQYIRTLIDMLKHMSNCTAPMTTKDVEGLAGLIIAANQMLGSVSGDVDEIISALKILEADVIKLL